MVKLISHKFRQTNKVKINRRYKKNQIKVREVTLLRLMLYDQMLLPIAIDCINDL